MTLMEKLRDGNWGLKLLALVLAVVIYTTLKTETAIHQKEHDRTIFQSR